MKKKIATLFFFLLVSCFLYIYSIKINKTTKSKSDYQENTSLYLGNPSKAEKNEDSSNNYLMEKKQFSLSYNNSTLNPNWVAWHLSSENIGDTNRKNTFRPDTELPKNWYAVRQTDYKFPAYGFDRGHICPSADRTSSSEDNSMTFVMTNMVPQTPDNNRIVWGALENFERDLVQKGNEVYIIAGPLGKGGTSDRGYFEEIPVTTNDGIELAITVPAYTWKILLILPDGDEDLNRITINTQILAVCVPNKKSCSRNGSWQQYICSVNYIEERTGYDFFDILPDELEEALEEKIYQPERR